MSDELGADVTATEVGTARDPGGGKRTGRPAREGLATPRAARRAVVLRELLGPPVALRARGSDVPGLRP